VLLKDSGELVLRLPAQLPRKDFKPGALAGSRIHRRPEQVLHLAPAVFVLMRKVHSGESDLPRVPTVPRPGRVVNARLRGKRQHGNPFVAEVQAVAGKHVGIGGENVVEKFCCGQEVLVVRRVFLVPEDGRQSCRPASLNKFTEHLRRAGGPRDFAPPQSGVTRPGGFDDDEIQCLVA